jgi:hypothetical protein
MVLWLVKPETDCVVAEVGVPVTLEVCESKALKPGVVVAVVVDVSIVYSKLTAVAEAGKLARSV